MHDLSTKLPVSRSDSLTFTLCPKCVPNDPLGVAGTFASGVREIVNDTNAFLYGDCPDPGVIDVFKSPIVWGLLSYTRSFT